MRWRIQDSHPIRKPDVSFNQLMLRTTTGTFLDIISTFKVSLS